MSLKANITAQTVINALIERFEELEDETGVDFAKAKLIISRFAKKHEIFGYMNN